ncbi:uncharacterized [Tachysurus ichikawai]
MWPYLHIPLFVSSRSTSFSRRDTVPGFEERRIVDLWSSSGVPLEFLWSSSGVPLEFLWSSSGVPAAPP